MAYLHMSWTLLEIILVDLSHDNSWYPATENEPPPTLGFTSLRGMTGRRLYGPSSSVPLSLAYRGLGIAKYFYYVGLRLHQLTLGVVWCIIASLRDPTSMNNLIVLNVWAVVPSWLVIFTPSQADYDGCWYHTTIRMVFYNLPSF